LKKNKNIFILKEIIMENRYRDDLLPILCLFLLSSIFFWKIIVTPYSMIYFSWSDILLGTTTVSQFYDDVTLFFYPAFYFANELFRGDGIPLWNSYINSGYPFIADIQAAMFYPFHIFLGSILPAYLIFGYSYLLHIFLAGFFMYLLTKYIGLDRFSSLGSAIIFMFSGFLIANVYVGQYTVVTSSIWIPLIFLVFIIAVNKKSLFYGSITGLFLGFQILAGHTQIPFYTIFALVLYLLFRYLITIKELNFDHGIKLISIFILAVSFGVLLSAIQFFPAFEFSKYSTRAGGISYDFATSSSFSVKSIATYFLPNFFGNLSDNSYWNIGRWGELYQYMGILPLILTLIAIWFKRDNKFVIFFSILSFFSFLLALGANSPIYWLVWKFIPGFDMFRVPSRILVLFTFSVSILSGFGFNFLKENHNLHEITNINKILKTLMVASIFLGIIILFYYFGREYTISFGRDIATQKYFDSYGKFPLHPPLDYFLSKVDLIFTNILYDLIFLIFLIVGSIGIIKSQINKKIKINHFNAIVIFFILSNLWFYHMEFIDTENPNEIYYEPEYVSFIKEDPGLHRIFKFGNVYPNNFQILYEINDVGGYNPLNIAHYSEFLSNIRPLSDNNNHPILSLLNVKYIITSEELKNSGFNLVYKRKGSYVYENEQVLPKAFVLCNSKLMDSQDILSQLKNKDFNPTEQVLLEHPVSFYQSKSNLMSSNENCNEKRSDIISIIKYSSNEILIETNTTHPGFLVLSEIWYPNWEAYVDGESRYISKSYYTLRSIPLEEGNHSIRFIFNPISFKVGFWITTLTATLLAIIIGIRIKKVRIFPFH